MNYRLKGASGALTGKAFELEEITTIGSADDAAIRIDGLQAEHARIVLRDGGLVVEARGDCALNGEPVREAALESGDELRFGNVRLMLQAPGLKPARVLDRVPERRGFNWKAALAAGLSAAAGALAAWWWLVGPGAG